LRNWKGKLNGTRGEAGRRYLALLLALLLFSSIFLSLTELFSTTGVSVIRASSSQEGFEGQRVESIDIMINYYGVKETPSYTSVDMDYTPFCQVKNRDNANTARYIAVYLNIINEDNGTEVWNGSESIMQIGPFDYGEVTFDPWHPDLEGNYRLDFEINYSSVQYEDPEYSNNKAQKNMFIQEKVLLSIESMELFPDKMNYTYDEEVQINVTIVNDALSNVHFILHVSVTNEGSHSPLLDKVLNISLEPMNKVLVNVSYTFLKISKMLINASIERENNEKEIYKAERTVNVVRIEPPIPLITEPVSNILPSEKTILYFTDTPVPLDARNSTVDANVSVISYIWTSNVDGLISEMVIDNAMLSRGLHEITLSIYDGYYTRNERTIIKVSERGTATLEADIASVKIEFVGGNEISIDILEVDDPGVLYPKEESLNIFRKISIGAQLIPESLLTLNISINYKEHLIKDGEIITDESSIRICVYNGDTGSWDEIGIAGFPEKNTVSISIPNPNLITTIGVFSNVLITKAKLFGTVYGRNPYTGDLKPLHGAIISFDRGRLEERTDENGNYSLTYFKTFEFLFSIKRGGYITLEKKISFVFGEEKKQNFVLEVKLGGINGSVMEFGIPGKYLSGVEVSLVPISGQVTVPLVERYVNITNKTGNFTFRNVSIGRYQLVLTPFGDYIGGDPFEVLVDYSKINELGKVDIYRNNNLPTLRIIGVSMSTGYKGDLFYFSVEYTDADGEMGDCLLETITPAQEPLVMSINRSSEVNFTLGVRYDTAWIAPAWGTYRFEFTAKDARGGKAASTKEVIIIINEVPKDPPPPNYLPLIVSIVVGVLVIGGVIIFFYMRSKKVKYFCPECDTQVELDDFECPECGEELPDFAAMEEDEVEEDDFEEEEEEEDDVDFDTYTSIKS
jgi:hypothetical protein